jgi:hypothetical protein
MKTIKTIYSEAIYREDIERNPAEQIGNIKYEKDEVGVFSIEELLSFFPNDGLGPWKDIYDYTCFLFAYSAENGQSFRK